MTFKHEVNISESCCFGLFFSFFFILAIRLLSLKARLSDFFFLKDTIKMHQQTEISHFSHKSPQVLISATTEK